MTGAGTGTYLFEATSFPADGAYTVANKRFRTYDVTFDSSYPTGGESLTAANVDLKKVVAVFGTGVATATVGGTTGVVVAYDHTNSKLQAFESTTGAPSKLAEVASTTSLATYICRLTFVGW